MNPKLQRRVQRYGWDKAVDHYELFWSRQLAPSQDLLLEMADIRPGERVADLACGTGLVTFPAAEAVGSEGSVLGTDISQGMVDTAAALARDRGLDQTRFARMEAEALDLPDEDFDTVLCSLGLMYVPTPLDACHEMRRVLRPGGRAVASVWGERRNCGWAEIFPIVDARVETDVCPLFFQLGTAGTLAAVMASAGFVEIETRRLPVTLRYETAADALGAAFAGGPVALAYDRFDEKTRDEAHVEYLASIEPHRRDDAFEIPGEFVVVSGIRPE